MEPSREQRVSALLREAAETHHKVYRISDGDDPDWASWYATWLIDLSELPEILGSKPVRSHLVHLLVELERAYANEGAAGPWQDFYARGIIAELS